MHVLVTGGAGFIGSHACKKLARAGFVPVTFDNLSTGHADAIKFGPFVKGDVRDQTLLASTLEQYDIKGIIHFAASAYVGESVVDPGKYYNNNLVSMIALLDAARASGVDKIVLSSSCATYGIPAQLPIREDSDQRPVNPYGWTKLICEQMLKDNAAAYGLQYMCLRYFNAAGADPEGELGERHSPETHLIPLALLAAAAKLPALDIFGTDYDTPDGTCVRDYIHVDDLARAHVLALQHLLRGGESLSLNLGSGVGHSVRQIIAAVTRVTGLHIPVREQPRRPGDPPVLTADPSLCAARLGFVTAKSDLESIIADAAPWFIESACHARAV
jgi:UDP-arabinose 4-epimerase